MDFNKQQELLNKWKINFNTDEKLTLNCNKKLFLDLKRKFTKVSVVAINDIFERYRIGSTDENAILGKDYVIIERHPQFFSFTGSLERKPGSTIPYVVFYDFDERILYELKFSESVRTWHNIKVKFFRFSKFAINWIKNKYPFLI